MVTIGDTIKKYKINGYIHIPRETTHRLENTGTKVCIIAEAQTGDYFGEDDIIRLEDIYGRA